MLLSDYVHALRESRHSDATRILDQTYDITVDKFSHLGHDPCLGDDTHSDEQLKYQGPDCRYYYRGFLRWMDDAEMKWVRTSRIEKEYRTARLLQRFVTRHFYLSLLEARRSANPLVSRYSWKIEGRGSITVWLPRTMKGEDRNKWLEENVEDPDPCRPNERERVQAIIDARIVRNRLIPLEYIAGTTACRVRTSNPRQAALYAEREAFGLAEFVAKEKTLSIELQRRAIRTLGPAKLEKLVIAVFDNILEQEMTEEELARKFGLSKAAFSRFAGSRWAKKRDGSCGRIPDLWLNTAHVLAHYPKFVQLAEQAGVLASARTAAEADRLVRMRNVDNE